MNKRKRLFAAWLCTLLVIPTAVSCADGNAAPTKDTAGTENQSETVKEETVDPTQAALNNATAKLDGTDYAGYTFRIMDRSEEQDPNWETIDVWSESENGDTINDAVYQRNRLLEENLNIKITNFFLKL